ncbi:MAG: hypothetical protein ABIL09_22600, partial [Gemmatimonadota bacterium]
MKEPPHIAVRGAAEGPLRGVDLDLPLGSLLAFSGPAGSGARVMAFEVLLAESRRRYLQALSPFEREAAGGAVAGAAVDAIDGLPPAACLPGILPRATSVAAYLHVRETMADLIRRWGDVACPACGGVCRSYGAGEAADYVMATMPGQRALVIAPLELAGGASAAATAGELRRAGFLRLRLGGALVRLPDDDGELARLPGLEGAQRLEVIIDRLAVATPDRGRLAEAIRNARAMARGRSLVVADGPGGSVWVSQQLSCTSCGEVLEDLSEADLLPAPGEGGGRQVGLRGLTVNQLHDQSVGQALAFWTAAAHAGSAEHGGDAGTEGAVAALLAALRACLELGLDHLPLSRPVGALSRGEGLLLSLAAARSRDLSGILYVLGLPLAVLDPATRGRALAALRALVSGGNTVLAVESEPEVLAACDAVYHFESGSVRQRCGPAGEAGQPGVGAGATGSVTPLSEQGFRLRGSPGSGNLRQLDLEVPLGCLVCFTGPTGAGKSALLEGLLPQLVGSKGRGPRREARGAVLRVDDGGLRRLVVLGGPGVERQGDDRPVLVHLGLAEALARVYADTPAARERGYPPEWFELDRPGGRCTTCEGRGVLRWDLDFLESMSLVCPACRGRRYRPEVLDVAPRGVSISDVLDMTVAEGASHFARHDRLSGRLEAARDLGLGPRQLGLAAARLDPAEILRLHLAVEVSRATGRDLFVLPYPAAGLHATDVGYLLDGLCRLVGRGASVWVEDRHPQVLSAAALVVEIGPGSGPAGGQVA